MLKTINLVNNQWNRFVFWFHDASTRTNIRWLVALSVWAFDRMFWRLPEQYQLVCGIPFKEYELRHQLELARHQSQYWAEYAYDLQWHIIESMAEHEEPKENEQETPPSAEKNKTKASRRTPQKAHQT